MVTRWPGARIAPSPGLITRRPVFVTENGFGTSTVGFAPASPFTDTLPRSEVGVSSGVVLSPDDAQPARTAPSSSTAMARREERRVTISLLVGNTTSATLGHVP